jgi:cytochrome c peroxidase
MNCHTLLTPKTPESQKVRDAFAKGAPIPWVRVHKLADFAYFDHSAHVNKGVSCVTCHGRVDQMDDVREVSPLSMVWCLNCHRNPAPNIRDRALVANLAWKPEGDPAKLGRQFMEKYHVMASTDCSICHR